MKISREMSILTLVVLISFLHLTTASKKQLNSPCSVSSYPQPDADSSYEDDEMDGHMDGHMYKRSVLDDVDLFPDDDECEQNHQLKCINGTCQIHCHSEQIFDSIKQKCLGKAGHECGRHGKQRFCVPNAKCDLSFCYCGKGFGVKDGYCVEASKYGEVCNAERPCDKKSGMDCINGHCECSFGSENQWYEPNDETCYSFPEGECTSDALCANNTFCSVADIYHDSQVHSAIDNVYVKKCQCRRGFILSETSRSCMAAWGSRCHNTPCHENFKCAEGKCQCHNPSYQVPDNSTNQCIGLVGSHCSTLDPVTSCVDNAECINGVCTCIAGYSSGGKLRKCHLDFGQPCQYVPPPSYFSNCNFFRGLTCLDGVCDCLDSIHVYNNVTQSCVLVKNSTVTDNDATLTSDKQFSRASGSSVTDNDPKITNDKQFAYATGSSKSYINFLIVTLIFSWNVFIF